MILEDVEKFIRRFVSFSDHEALVTTLWLAHANLVYDLPDGVCSPRLAILSPTKECGKSTLLEVTGALLPNAIATVNVSPAALYRMMTKKKPTLQLDEIDQKSLDDKLELIHAGFKKGAGSTVYRCNDNNYELEDFNVFGPLMFAGIDKGQMLDITISRSIPIRMTPNPNVTPFRMRLYGDEALKLQQELTAWVQSIKDKAMFHSPCLPKELNGRRADKWEVLFTIAELAQLENSAEDNTGTDARVARLFWGRLRAAAAVIDAQQARVDEVSDGEVLREDIDYILKEYKGDYIFSNTLISLLINNNDKWRYYTKDDKPLNSLQLSKLLRPYSIIPESQPFKIGMEKSRGYRVEGLRVGIPEKPVLPVPPVPEEFKPKPLKIMVNGKYEYIG